MDFARDPSFQRNRRIRRLGLGAVLVVVLGVAAFAVMRLKPAAPTVDGSAVWADRVKRGDMLRQVHGIGTLAPEEIRSIPATTDGRVTDIPMLPGAPVTAGAVLVQLTNPLTVKALADAQAQLAGAQADLDNLRATLASQLLDQQSQTAQLEASWREARMLADSDNGLLAKGLVAKLDAETDADKVVGLKAQVDLAQQKLKRQADADAAQIDSQQARIEQQKNAVALARQQVEALTVRAGISGLLEDFDMGGGATLQPGQWVTAGTTVARVVQPRKLKAQIKIAETEVRDVQLGQPASIDTHNGVVAGRVSRIDPNSQNGTVTVDVALTGPPPPGSRPDLGVDGTIDVESLRNVLFVGRPAAGQPDSTVSLFKVLPGGKEGVRVQVALGKTSVNSVQVLHGLGTGDWVVLSDTTAQDNFDRVRFDPPVASVAAGN